MLIEMDDYWKILWSIEQRIINNLNQVISSTENLNADEHM